MFSRYQQHAASRPGLTAFIALLFTSVIAYVGTAARHSLLTSALAWLAICAYTSFTLGRKGLIGAGLPQKLAWAAGGLLALGQVQEKAVNGSGVWWAKALWPLIICAINGTCILDSEPANTKSGAFVNPTLTTPFVILTASAVAATSISVGSNSALTIGLSYALLGAVALLLIQRAKGYATYGGQLGGAVIYSANGLLSQPEESTTQGSHGINLALIRDVSGAAAFFTGLAAITLEGISFGDQAYLQVVGHLPRGDVSPLRVALLNILYPAVMVVVHAAMDSALLLTVQHLGAFSTAFVPLIAAICSQFVVDFSFGRLWFATLCAASAWIFFDDQTAGATSFRARMRAGRLLTLVAILSFALFLLYNFRQPLQVPRFGNTTPSSSQRASAGLPKQALGPLPWDHPHPHPVDHLMRDAEASWSSKLQSQSQTLEAAVIEYRRRYGIPPPPHFDKWFEFAKRKGVQLIDEYDTIHHSLLPFWGLKPATIRARVHEAIGYLGTDDASNMLLALLIRNGEPSRVKGGQEWQQEATVGMMKEFIQYLPDMDLAFNIHDEPRVVVPHDILSQLVHVAVDEKMPAAFANRSPKNAFSPSPRGLSDGKRIELVKTTRFNVYAHQPVWIPSRLSCPPDSPARSSQDEPADNFTSYAMTDLGFVYNHTAFSDVCNSPSFGSSHGFFERPNAFNVVHELFPIFSQSKMSSFQDILYPSPWYWYGKVEYDGEKDMEWSSKTNSLYWRGSTTGGFSRDGGWRRQHRQQVVRKLSGLDTAKVYKNVNAHKSEAEPDWKIQDVPRKDYEEIMDVHFSHIGQCDAGDCDAMKEFFKVVEPADQQNAWKYRYLLDMDGNAFSGRFYAFLESHSLTFKMSVFREWHEEWIKPWVHYIPLSLRAEEGLEVVRYLSGEEEGKLQATRMAEGSREWAKKALRKEDFETWFFRLMLEYGRIIDDDRESIGFSGS